MKKNADELLALAVRALQNAGASESIVLRGTCVNAVPRRAMRFVYACGCQYRDSTRAVAASNAPAAAKTKLTFMLSRLKLR